MSENTNKNTQNTNEEDIDLITLIVRIIAVFRRNLYIFIITALLGAGWGFYLASTAKPVYESQMIISTRYLSDVEVYGVVNFLNTILQEGNTPVLAKKINLSENISQKLLFIEANNVRFIDIKYNDIYKSRDSVLVIKVKISDNKVLDSLQAGIIHYLNHLPYVQQKVQMRRENIKKQLTRLQKESKALDSIRVLMKEYLEKGKEIHIDPASTLLQTMGFYANEMVYNDQLQQLDNVRLIESFIPTQKGGGQGFLKNSVIYGSIGLALGVIIAFIKELNAIIRKRTPKTAS
ncbi:MAG: hypothetical protein EAZ55_05400 [Cytophagales bacterium]|nr:MAG: hypothetical protein EAZ55_05400 [Cytophagales bacterium]